MQRQYGKNLGELETLVEGFAWVLSDYSVQEVIRAMGIYLKTKSDIPTPSEIIKIIDPPFEPNWVYYKQLKELAKVPYGLGEDEKNYIIACEEYSLGKFAAAKPQLEAVQ